MHALSLPLCRRSRDAGMLNKCRHALHSVRHDNHSLTLTFRHMGEAPITPPPPPTTIPPTRQQRPAIPARLLVPSYGHGGGTGTLGSAPCWAGAPRRGGGGRVSVCAGGLCCLDFFSIVFAAIAVASFSLSLPLCQRSDAWSALDVATQDMSLPLLHRSDT